MEFTVNNYRYTPNTIEETTNNYAFLYSGAYKRIVGATKKETSNKKKLEGYLKVTSNHKKSVYLKYIGWNGVGKNEIRLTYYNQCALDVSIGDIVTVKPCSAFIYYWKCWDSGIRIPFKIANIGLWISIVSSIISIIVTFF